MDLGMGLTLTAFLAASVLDSRPAGDGIQDESSITMWVVSEDGEYIVQE